MRAWAPGRELNAFRKRPVFPDKDLTGRLRRLRFLEMTDGAFELVAATRIAEPDYMTAVFGEGIGLNRLAGSGAGLVDAIGNVESAHAIVL